MPKPHGLDPIDPSSPPGNLELLLHSLEASVEIPFPTVIHEIVTGERGAKIEA
jgi:hypothetical protein